MNTLQVLRNLAWVVGVVCCFGASAEARPRHLKVFAAAYPQVATKNKLTCVVCHDGGKVKTKGNNYGEALARHIEAREQNEDRIRAALEQIEPEPSAIAGKTFGDLLKRGLLPASKAADSAE